MDGIEPIAVDMGRFVIGHEIVTLVRYQRNARLDGRDPMDVRDAREPKLSIGSSIPEIYEPLNRMSVVLITQLVGNLLWPGAETSESSVPVLGSGCQYSILSPSDL